MNNFNQVFISGDKAFPESKEGFNSVSDTLIKNYETKPVETVKPTLRERMNNVMSTYDKQIQDSANLYKTGQQNIFSTLGQTLAGAVKAAGSSFAIPINIGLEKAFEVGGDLIKQGREAQKQADEQAIAEGRLVRGRDFILSDQPKIEDQIAGLLKKGVEVGKPVIDYYQSLSPEAKANLKAVADTGQGVLDLFGGAVGAKGVANFLEKSGAKTFDIATGKFVQNRIEGLKDTGSYIKDSVTSKPLTKDEVVGKILQGKTNDIPLGKIALDNIDTNGVKTFKELNARFQSAIPQFAQKVDEELLKDATKYTVDQLKVTKSAKDIQADPLLSKIAKISGTDAGEVQVDYVTQALKDLSELYTKTNDPVAKKVIDDAIAKSTTEGFTRQEVNDLARIYGSEFSNKAFSETGEPLTSVVAQAVENTRSGLKQVARAGIGGAEAKSADAVLEAFYNTQRLIQKNIEATNRARQKFTDRTTFEKWARVLGKTLDVATFGTIKGFMSSFIPRGVGNLQATFVDLEDALKYNLRLLNKIDEAKTPKEVEAFIKTESPVSKTPKMTPKESKTPTFTEGGIYSIPEKEQLYKDVIKPQLDKIGTLKPDETIIYYSGDGKAGQYVNTTLDEVWGYPVEDLKVKKVKTADLVSTGDTEKDGVGYRILKSTTKKK